MHFIQKVAGILASEIDFKVADSQCVWQLLVLRSQVVDFIPDPENDSYALPKRPSGVSIFLHPHFFKDCCSPRLAHMN